MPHSVSARKRVRQNLKRHERNRAIKSRIRTARRAFLKAVEADDVDGAREKLRIYEKLLHRAANNGPIQRNTAGRSIGRLQVKLNALVAAKTTA